MVKATATRTISNDKWLGDSGASSHVCNDMKYMGKSTPSEDKVTIGDSSTVKAEARGMAHLKTTEGQMVDLEDTLYIPEFDRNIISLGRFALKGHRIEMCDAVIKALES